MGPIFLENEVQMSFFISDFKKWQCGLSFKVEFVGGPMCWNTRTFSAAAGTKALPKLLYNMFFCTQKLSS